MPLRRVAVTHIGAIARGLLEVDRSASVMGVSSRGIFLHLQASWVLFLSYEQYRGPLTLNLEAGRRDLSLLDKGAELEIRPERMCLLSAGLEIEYQPAEVWQARLPHPDRILSTGQRRDRLVGILLELSRMQKTSPLAEMLPGLLSLERAENAQRQAIFQMLAAVRQAFIGHDTPAIVAGILPFLGMGAGLTPSGDDLAIGFLLALNRCGHVLAPELNLNLLNQGIVRGAYKSTTLLSANLIECASQGQADERLILGLDGMLSGDNDPGMCAASLASWGNTSGIDALVGMALAIGI